MGQRNATYIISIGKNHEMVFPLYNQWNYIAVQPAKLIRGIRRVLELKNSYESVLSNRAEQFGNIYFQACGLSPDTPSWVGGMYGGKITEPYMEDNNNGWNIVCFRRDADNEIKVSLFCIVGDEDGVFDENLSLQEYFALDKETPKEQVEELAALVTWDASLRDKAAELIRKGLHEEPNPDYFPRF